MLLGGGVWARRDGAWRCEAGSEPGGQAAHASAGLAAAVSAAAREQAVVVFEPEGLAHQRVETPRVGRRVFASLERVRREYPVVESEGLGWGMEPPEPAPGGAYSTLLHFELAPGLARVREACLGAGSRLTAAWSLFTAASACLRPDRGRPRARIVLVLVPDFAAVAVCGPRRSFKSWTGAISDREWQGIQALIAGGELPQQSLAESGRAGVTVVSEGEACRLCPFWKELRDAGRIESELGLDALAAGAQALPPGHPANLAEPFPEPRDLSPLLVGAGLAGLAAAAALGASALGQRRLLAEKAAADAARESAASERVDALERNRAEIARLRAESPDAAASAGPRREPALEALAAAVPEALTLSEVAISGDAFEIEACVIGADFDPDATRRAFSRGGLEPDAQNGWKLDRAAGRLSVRGRIVPPKP
jgi:hypothetical protein